MKLLIVLLFLSFGVSTFACTDFSGVYIGEDSSELQIVQTQCSSMLYDNKNIILDNKLHEFSVEDLTNVNGKVVGKIFTSSVGSFEGEKLNLNFKIHIESTDYQIPDSESKSVLILNTDGNLVLETTLEDGKVLKFIGKRK